MPQPFDYRIQVQNPMEAALSGLRLGAGIQEMRDARAAAMAKAEADRQFQESYQSVLANPNATGEDYGRLVAMRPDLQQSIAKSWEMRDESSRKADLQATQKAYFAAMNGDPQTAADALLENATAYRNSGREEDAKRMEAAADAIAANPAQAKATMGIFLSSVAPKDWAETISKVGAETRAQEVAPYEAEVKRVDAKYAEQIKEGELAKINADLKKLKDAESGIIPAEDRFKAEKDLADKYLPFYKEYAASERFFRKGVGANAGVGDGAADLALTFAYVKSIDDGAAVMEGDKANVEGTSGPLRSALNIYNKVAEGGDLDPETARRIKSELTRLHSVNKASFDKVRRGMEIVVKNNGLNPDNVFYAGSEGESDAPPAGAVRVVK